MAGLPKIVHILGGIMVVISDAELDTEWVELIKQALEVEITIEEIRAFLNKN
ncbi:anti-repressor SinI family protein [Mesobacillus foraminis]|uniref:anti-repressor SinI family protein n=1 Tax=Mesobacillus foraminis TaxID=279826 RepID=UPI00214BA1CF|nr:anti-repressor SinI family protein [Mesobacillus foraminis]